MFAMLFVALLAGLAFQPQPALAASVVSLEHAPLAPTPDDEITVTLQLDNASTVKTTLIVWCQSKPAMCNWKNMTYIGDNTFTINIGKFTDGQEIKYNISIAYTDGNTSVTETKHFNVEKPSNGNGGTQNNTTNNNTAGDDAKPAPNYMPYIAVVVVLVAVVAVAAFIMRRKKPGSQ
jgi:hypothetical protein